MSWLFGYGSLLPAGESRPCDLTGWQRSWGVAMDNSVDLPGYKHFVTPDGERPVETRLADTKYRDAAAKGYFPLNFVIANIDQNGPVATAFVTATAANGAAASQPVTFVNGPSPTGWQLSKQSALALLSSVG